MIIVYTVLRKLLVSDLAAVDTGQTRHVLMQECMPHANELIKLTMGCIYVKYFPVCTRPRS